MTFPVSYAIAALAGLAFALLYAWLQILGDRRRLGLLGPEARQRESAGIPKQVANALWWLFWAAVAAALMAS